MFESLTFFRFHIQNLRPVRAYRLLAIGYWLLAKYNFQLHSNNVPSPKEGKVASTIGYGRGMRYRL
jgi:hypothetical protein